MMKTEATVSQPTAPAGSPLMQVSGALIGIIALILAEAKAGHYPSRRWFSSPR